MNDQSFYQMFPNFAPQGYKPGGQQPQKKKKNFWTDQISTATGILGGIGGSFVAPIAGTAAGAAAGSALGEAIEKMIDPRSTDWGDVAQEGVLGGVLGAGPFKLLKGGAAGAKALATGGDVVGQASKAATTSLLRNTGSKWGRNLLADAWGTKAGSKINGEILSPEEATKLNHFIINNIGAKRGSSADDVLGAAFAKKKESGQLVGKVVKENNRALDVPELNKIVTNIEKRLDNIAGTDWRSNPRAVQLLKQLKEKQSLEDIHKFRVKIDDGINFSRNSATPDPIYEQIAKEFRDELGDHVKKAVPSVGSHQEMYGQASKVIDTVAPHAKSPRGINILNNKIGGVTTQKGKAYLGGAVGNPKGNVGMGNQGKRGGLGIAGRIAVGENAIPVEGRPSNLEDAINDQSWPNTATTTTNTINPNTNQPNMMGGLYSDEQDMSSPYSRENLMADLQRDPENAKDYIAYYSSLQEIFSPQSSQKPMSTESAKSVSNAETGLAALGDFEGEINRDPSILTKRNIPGRGLLGGVLGGALGTRGADAAANQIIDVIARLRTGAAITADEAKRFEQFIPTSGDSSGVRQQKLSYLRNQFNMVAQRGQQGGGSLEDALMQYSGGQGY